MNKNKKNKNIDVSIVSPAQAAVEQAKSEVRDMMDINRGKKEKCIKLVVKIDVKASPGYPHSKRNKKLI